MRARRTDGNHAPTLAVLRSLGYPCKSLHTQGGGCEDILVGTWIAQAQTAPGLGVVVKPTWVLLEMKISTNKSGTLTPSRFKATQLAWYAHTKGFPRIVATSPEDAIKQLRGLT